MIRRHLCHLTGIGLLMLALATLCAGEAAAATLTVCRSGCAFTQIAPAVAAAGAGDTVSVAAGSYKGGFQITKDLSLVGAGANRTTITGGGPVITVGTFGAAGEPTVSISGVTVTGGLTTSSDQSDVFFGDPNVWAIGGGIYVPFAAGFTPGATLTITDSVVTGNQVSPTSTAPIGPPCPGGVPCPFAEAAGGGIGDEGSVTLVRTRVTNNQSAGGTTSDADGAGVWIARGGALTMRDSTVGGNLAQASDPNGRFAEGAGIFAVFQATVVISDSSVSGNTARLTSSLPFFIGGGDVLELGAHAGGIHMGDGGSLTISDSHVDGNTVSAADPNGQLEVFDAGLCVCGNGSTLSLRDSSVSGNRLTALMATNGDLFQELGLAGGGAFEIDGPATVDDTLIAGNTSLVVGLSGPIVTNGTVLDFTTPDTAPGVISDSMISDNAVAVISPGPATMLGGGVFDAGVLELRGDRIRNNVERANAAGGNVQGGGIWAGPIPGTPFPVQLTVEGSTVTRNVLSGSNSSILLQGGGLFTTVPVTLTDSLIVKNTPDNCSGVSC